MGLPGSKWVCREVIHVSSDMQPKLKDFGFTIDYQPACIIIGYTFNTISTIYVLTTRDGALTTRGCFGLETLGMGWWSIWASVVNEVGSKVEADVGM